MEFSKSQIYSLISQRIEKLQTSWYANLDKNILLDSFDTPSSIQEIRNKEISNTIDNLLSEINQDIDLKVILNWKLHFGYQIFPINKVFKKAILHFFNPIMINALGMNVIGQAYMLSLLIANDGNDDNFAFKKATEFMKHINSILDEPYEDHTLQLFIQSIYINYKTNFMELAVQYSEVNNLELTYYFFHRKRFDLPLPLTESGNSVYLYNHLNTLTIATENIKDSILTKFPETMQNTVFLRNALFSTLFGNMDIFLNSVDAEVNSLPLGRSGFVLEEIVDSYSIDVNSEVVSYLIYNDLSFSEFSERLAEHFSFMHDYLLCDTVLYNVAKDLFDKKIIGRSLFLLKPMEDEYNLDSLFEKSYQLYIDKRFINTLDEFDGLKLS